MMSKGPYGVPSPHIAATMDVGNPNNSVQFANPGASYSKGKRQSTQFTFETGQLKSGPLSYSADTSTGVFGARANDALTNPSGRA